MRAIKERMTTSAKIPRPRYKGQLDHQSSCWSCEVVGLEVSYEIEAEKVEALVVGEEIILAAIVA